MSCEIRSFLSLLYDYTMIIIIITIIIILGADINYAACSNSGCQGGDMSLACYWLFVVATGDVTWAAELM